MQSLSFRLALVCGNTRPSYRQLISISTADSVFYKGSRFLSTNWYPTLTITDKKSCLGSSQELRSHLLVSHSFLNPLTRRLSTSAILFDQEKMAERKASASPEPSKKQSKFRQFYAQYGPIFIFVHLSTVVMWIYLFFIISKQ